MDDKDDTRSVMPLAERDEEALARVDAAVSAATRDYLAARRARVEAFAQRHFGWRGALRLNRRALGRDLLRTPLNLLWAGPYLLGRSAGALAGRLGARGLAGRMARLPAGLRTDVQREVEWLIYTELLELPFRQGARENTHDALFESVLAQPAVSELLVPELVTLDELARHRALRPRLERHLATYTSSRTAASDLSGALLNLAAGVAAFSKVTPGSVAMGSTAATALAQHLAVSNFVLGPTLGSLYYAVVPAAASGGLLIATTGGVMLAVGVVGALAGVVTDPVQQALGLHRRKLHRLIDALEAELLGEREAALRIHDAYVARVFDLWDLLQGATRLLP